MERFTVKDEAGLKAAREFIGENTNGVFITHTDADELPSNARGVKSKLKLPNTLQW